MPGSTITVPYVLAVVCVLYAIVTGLAEIGDPDDRVAALVVALLLVLVGTGAAAIDEKVGEAGEAVSLDFSTSEKEHAAFTRIEQVHSGPLDHDLCVVRFYERKRGPRGSWWTDCGQGRSLDTVAEAREQLALRYDWGKYSGRIQYTIPEGTDVTYLRGTIAAQCERGEWKEGCPTFNGGGNQYLFPEHLDPGKAGVDERCAASAKEPPPNPAEYKRCP